MIKVKRKKVQKKPLSSLSDVQHNVPKVVEEFTKVKHKEVFGNEKKKTKQTKKKKY